MHPEPPLYRLCRLGALLATLLVLAGLYSWSADTFLESRAQQAMVP